MLNKNTMTENENKNLGGEAACECGDTCDCKGTCGCAGKVDGVVTESIRQEIPDGDFYCKRFYKEMATFPLSFWEVIEKLDWKGACETSDAPYKVVGQRLWELIKENPRLGRHLQETFRAYKQVLKTAIEDYEMKASGHRFCQKTIIWHGCDDSFDDITSHIVGLGKDAYFAVLNDPILANQYTDEYVESFAYVFHFPEK